MTDDLADPTPPAVNAAAMQAEAEGPAVDPTVLDLTNGHINDAQLAETEMPEGLEVRPRSAQGAARSGGPAQARRKLHGAKGGYSIVWTAYQASTGHTGFMRRSMKVARMIVMLYGAHAYA
eukprot:353614-Chlamydomonas_euryale.AAC.3